MKKSELIEQLVKESDSFEEGMNNKQKTTIAREAVNQFFNSIKEPLKKGDRVEIRGFGSFHMREYDGYVGRNPKNGKRVTVKPKKLPHFRPGRELKKMVDK